MVILLGPIHWYPRTPTKTSRDGIIWPHGDNGSAIEFDNKVCLDGIALMVGKPFALKLNTRLNQIEIPGPIWGRTE